MSITVQHAGTPGVNQLMLELRSLHAYCCVHSELASRHVTHSTRSLKDIHRRYFALQLPAEARLD